MARGLWVSHGNLQLEEPETYAPPCIHTITGIGAKGFVSGAATLRKRQSSETGVPSGEFPMDMHRLPKVVPLRVAFGKPPYSTGGCQRSLSVGGLA